MVVVVEREWVSTWIIAMFSVALGIVLIFIWFMLLSIGGSFEYLMYQHVEYSLLGLRAILTTGYAIAIFVMTYGFKRIIDSILKAWTKTIVKTTK